jgi:cell division protein FtsI/penicillin-binding protein 2
MSWDRSLKYMVTSGLVLTMVVLLAGLAKGRGFIGLKPMSEPRPGAKLSGDLTPPPPAAKLMAKEELAALIGPRDIDPTETELFQIVGPEGQLLYVRTTLDPDLQAQAQKWVKGSGALRAALVVLEPGSGRVLALAGSGDEEGNSALEGDFPAASVFKIVTAAAVVEKAEYNATTTVAYDGAKHTLYKSNVAKGPDQGRHQATLSDSFAESINSVFGKLGTYSLEPDDLAEMAASFGFNESLAFELPLDVSSFDLGPGQDDDRFHLAELASGFNRETRISPVHGALIASVALNGGEFYEPTIVSEVSEADGKVVYIGAPRLQGQAISLQTAEELSVMMQAAVSDGTGRKHFSGAAKDPVLSRLVLGGKSGTINDESGAKVDWFVAFASPASDDESLGQLAMSAVVVHDGRTNVASQELVRKALKAYYSPRFGSEGENADVLAGQKARTLQGRS